MDCVFCGIAAGKIPAPRILENDLAFVIRDIQPHAKQHFLVVPKVHTSSLIEAFAAEGPGRELLGGLYSLVNELAVSEKLILGGYRTVINTGENGGQTVPHLHIHVLGGEKLKGFFG